MTFEKVRHIIAEHFNIKEDEITPQSSVREDFGADSLDLVDLAMTIEDEFGIEVPDEELEKIQTVDDIVQFIESN